VHPDEVAGAFGFADGKELLTALADASDKDAVVEHETRMRFERTFGPPLARNADALAATGADAMHSPADVQYALAIRDIIARALGRKAAGGKLPDARANAERVIQGTRTPPTVARALPRGERRE
jgi:hypothetical protein